jgi:hypothetical protein
VGSSGHLPGDPFGGSAQQAEGVPLQAGHLLLGDELAQAGGGEVLERLQGAPLGDEAELPASRGGVGDAAVLKEPDLLGGEVDRAPDQLGDPVDERLG